MRNGSTQEQKRHYKLYKSGTQWVTAAIITFGAGLVVIGGASANTTHAAESTPAAVAQTQQATTDSAAPAAAADAANAANAAGAATTAAADATAPAASTTATDDSKQAAAPAATATSTATDNGATAADAASADANTDANAAAKTTTTVDANAAATTAAKTTATTTKTAAATTTADDAPADGATSEVTDANTPPMNRDTLTTGNVQGLWDQGYQGQGMVVAVIDSGVAPHADLRLSDDSTAAISKEDAEALIAKLGYGRYVNSKIPFVYDYSNNDSINTENTVASSTHGEHVAGIIAANGTTADGATEGDGDAADYVKGIGPEAQIIGLQVIDEFADENFNDISRAIRDAVTLGANVIQMSLGIGVAEQDLTDEEQAAVKYATDHGVYVSISASNDGDATAIQGSADAGGITSIYDDESDIKNDSTVADPGASPSAATVAAEYSTYGYDADGNWVQVTPQMASFSSWGPTVDYTLKPDITAPGYNVVSTTVDTAADGTQTQDYGVESGTSMAGPYDAGAAAIVMQKLKATRPDLSGAALVEAVKLAIMNAAQPMIDSAYSDDTTTTYVSPRRQGAGMIDVSKAGDLTVSAEGTDDAGSVSLNTIGNATDFTVTLTNHGDSAQNYTVDYDGGPSTQAIDTDNDNTIYDTALAGATLTTDTPSFSLAAGETKDITFHLNLDDSVAADQIVEGFFTFKADDDTQTINMPYLGYFGDLTNNQIVDPSANDEDSAFNGGYLVDENANVLGVTDPTSLSDLVNSNKDADITWDSVGAKVENGKVSFSPNNDNVSDTVYPYVFTTQSLKSVTIEILDADGNVVRTLDKENNTTKSYHQDGSAYNQDLGLSVDMRLDQDAFTWDGTIYDQATGKYVTAPDGNYTYRIATEQYNEGTDQDQTFDLPVAIDTVAPTISNLTYKDGTVSFDYDDQGEGFTGYSSAVLAFGDGSYGFTLNNDGKTNNGSASYTLTSAQQEALATADGKLTLTISDVAGNATSADLTAAVPAATSTTTADASDAVVAPQFVWQIGEGSYNRLRAADGFIQTTTNQKEFTAYGLVPVGFQGTVTATDDMTGKRFEGTVDQATGVVTFHLSEGAPYGEFVGVATLAGDNFGEYYTSPVTATSTLIAFLGDDYDNYSETNVHPIAALTDNATAQANVAEVSANGDGAGRDLPGRAFDDVTTHAAPTEGLSFDNFNDNTFTLIGADKLADIYDAATGELTITGTLEDAANKTMTFTDATEPTQDVKIGADGKFSFTVPFKEAEQQAVGYRITTTADDGTQSTAYGQLEIYLDNIFPTLEMPQADTLSVDANGDYEITTSSNTFTVSGTVDDNINGYRLYTNGDNIIHQKNLAGFNNHDDPTSTTSNPYGAEAFSQTYDLQKGDNYFTVSAVDMVGNTVTKIFHVIRVDGQVGRNDTIANGIKDGVVVRTKIATGDDPVLQPLDKKADKGQKPHAKTFKTKAEAQAHANATAAKAAKAAAKNAKAAAKADAATYPATGEAKSPLAALGIALMSLLGLAGFVSKKKRA